VVEDVSDAEGHGTVCVVEVRVGVLADGVGLVMM